VVACVEVQAFAAVSVVDARGADGRSGRRRVLVAGVDGDSGAARCIGDEVRGSAEICRRCGGRSMNSLTKW
jgi:hypothetical protein